MKKIIIAIDGYSSTGKSTLARQLAEKLHYTYIDSGAMYRAITLFFLQHQVDLTDTEKINTALSAVRLGFTGNKICLNGKIVEEDIRKMEISEQVSEVSALEPVRNFAVAQQQALGSEKGIVMDGRDIGTTVFPEAELKIFLFASEEIRIQRRFDELRLKSPSITEKMVADNLKHRDHLDSTRTFSPLRKAADAVMLDNSHLDMTQQLQIAYEWASTKTGR